ncbi:CE1759 family FMN reductase [Actinomyces sp.]|uniref:CE1759 family FMN reductase n=1 Tax=Actinomyces sp. TaxID=29317 RepID=UPI0028A11F19|nr:CE1759 family FMN reductase [Actinomyces sp.]
MSDHAPVSVAVVNAGLSDASSTARLGHAVVDALQEAASRRGTGVDARAVDLRPLSHGIADALTLGFAPPEVQEALDTVAGADALVALTPVYRASYSGLFKSFFDVLDEDALRGTPVLLGATGGTPRHALVTETAMRPLFTYLHAPAVTTALYAATEDWGAHASDSDGLGGARLGRRIRQGAEELLDALRLPAGTTEGGGVGREETTPGPDAAEDFPGFVDFETLLHRGGLR